MKKIEEIIDNYEKYETYLEEGLEDWDEDNYAMYGKPLFKATAEKYGWNLDDE